MIWYIIWYIVGITIYEFGFPNERDWNSVVAHLSSRAPIDSVTTMTRAYTFFLSSPIARPPISLRSRICIGHWWEYNSNVCSYKYKYNMYYVHIHVLACWQQNMYNTCTCVCVCVYVDIKVRQAKTDHGVNEIKSFKNYTYRLVCSARKIIFRFSPLAKKI